MSDFAKMSGWQMPDAQPHEVIRAAGYAVILASAAAAILPATNFENGPLIVGGLMFIVGLIEVLANLLRATGKRAGAAAGAASVAAGVLIFAQPVSSFVTTVYVFIGWLLVRGLLLGISAIENVGPIRRATSIAAAMDLILAAVVWTGLTASTLVIALFGPTKPIIAHFAWVVAISFVGSGFLLVRLASEQGSN
ncbi:MAG TPA: hypothetical protein VFT40_01135 [Sphingomicrobium sp.]|nr:hypothetical protein [Sphingomicrobium sp.]